MKTAPTRTTNKVKAMVPRRAIHGWAVRWDDARARRMHEQGWWVDHTVADLAAPLARDEPDRLLMVDGEHRLTAAELYRQAEALAKAMIARGFKPGTAVSFMLPNWHESAVIYLAATLAGLVIHPILPALRDSELRFMLEDTGSRMVFVPAVFRGYDYRAMLARVAKQLIMPPEIVVVRGEAGAGTSTSYESLLREGPESIALPRVDPESVKLVLYTSGTTGRPKAVLHSHNSIAALIRQIQIHWRIDESSRFFIPSPVTHIGGSIYAFESPFLLRSRAILQAVWNPDDAVAIIERERCTHMAGATPFLQQLLVSARSRHTHIPSLSVFICGGASVPPSLIREAAEYFENCTVTRVFGSTEVPVMTVGAMKPGDIEHAAETDGEIGMADIRVVDASGRETQGEGEICARGPQMLVGYLWTEDERNAFDDDGYFHTGDLGRIVDGNYLVITGRAKDIIIRQGENIAPKEIEDILSAHPDIAEVAIIGVPDAGTGERACAVIVPQAGARPDVAVLRAYLDERRVARFKIPEQVELRSALPRNSAGKVLKHKLREELSIQRRPRTPGDTLH